MRQEPLKQLAINDILAHAHACAPSAAEGTVYMPSGGNVVVWCDRDAYEKGLALVHRGMHTANPALFLPLIACIVPSGTRAVTTEARPRAQDILLVDGKHAGHRGSVPFDSFRQSQHLLDP